MIRILPQPGLRCLLLALCLLGTSAHAAPDIRVLVDTSGSMKTTDPQNLRIPAMKLLAELLPVGASAGIWLFDQGVTPLVPVSRIDASWKKKTRLAASSIHSRGLFTNIEDALAAASQDWAAPNADSDRHVVLLTDGKVDISKDASASAASRARVLGAQLDDLRQKGVKVHTIALSADVDTPLLAALASGTGGWHEEAPTAAALQRAFLHIFEQAAAPDLLPLTGNKFTVDSSVSEVTLLVFHKPGTPALKLTDPAGKTYSSANNSESLRWQQDEAYDLVTIKAPAPGKWSFNGESDPDNRALVVTNLSLDAGDLPTHITRGESFTLNARLLDQGKLIERNDFLSIVNAGAAITGDAGGGDMVELPLDEKTHGFTASVSPALEPGSYELTLRARSGTFEREKRHHLEIHGEPVSFTLAAIDAGKTGGAALKVEWTADAELVTPGSASGYLLVEGPDGYRDVLELGGKGEPLAPATLEVPTGGEYKARARLFLKDHEGHAMELRPAPRSATVKGPAAGEAHAPTSTPAAAASPAHETPAAAPVSVLRSLAYIGLGNLALGLVIGPLWYVLRRRAMPAKGVSL